MEAVLIKKGQNGDVCISRHVDGGVVHLVIPGSVMVEFEHALSEIAKPYQPFGNYRSINIPNKTS